MAFRWRDDDGSILNTVQYLRDLLGYPDQYCYRYPKALRFSGRGLGPMSPSGSAHDVVVSVPCLFLAVAWVGMWPVVVAFPSHTHILHVFNRH